MRCSVPTCPAMTQTPPGTIATDLAIEPAAPDLRLNAATKVLWRDAHTVQFELGTRRIIIENVATRQLRPLLPSAGRGSRHTERAADRAPVETAGLGKLRDLLDRFGFLCPQEDTPALDSSAAGIPVQLRPELRAMVSTHGSRSGQVLNARRQAAVAVHGTTRLATTVAATLAAAGVGWVQLLHGGDVHAADACPGGLTPADEGRRFGVAAVDAVRRAAPDVDTTPIPRDRVADLVILTDPGPIDPTVRASLHLDGSAHLLASVDGQHAVIGPLVLPGVTSCLRCADLHRGDRDPAWPALVVQLANRGRYRTASDVALCVATAGLATTHAIAYLDGQHSATVEGTLEWRLPDWRLRRRTWPVHHKCDCGASARSARTRQNGTVILR
jgi:hypothetical protein